MWVPIVAAVPPTVTDVTVVKLVPVILRAWVAVALPEVGVSEVMAGARHVGEVVGVCRCAAHRGLDHDRVGAGGLGGRGDCDLGARVGPDRGRRPANRH